MHQHLQLVREFRNKCGLPKGQDHLSEMDIISNQARLMEKGGEVFQALKQADMAIILLCLVSLAYSALDAVTQKGEDLTERPVAWHHDGSVLSIMRLLSEKINQCASGKTEDYSAIYCICAYLTNNFLNASFNKALEMLHNHLMQNSSASLTGKPIAIQGLDLSECLYE